MKTNVLEKRSLTYFEPIDDETLALVCGGDDGGYGADGGGDGGGYNQGAWGAAPLGACAADMAGAAGLGAIVGGLVGGPLGAAAGAVEGAGAVAVFDPACSS
jgi:hypothetical protein